MKSLSGKRVFFKRKALHTLRSYWCHRWDELTLREILSRNYTPRYHVEFETLDGFYVKLERLDFLWYRGLFSVGRHLPSGIYYQDPVHLPLKGLGPRQLVFPVALANHVDQLFLLGDWKRYQLSAENWIDEDRALVRPSRAGGERVSIRVETVKIGYPPPVLHRWGKRESKMETVMLLGEVLSTTLRGYKVAVPISEVFWNYFTKAAH